MFIESKRLYLREINEGDFSLLYELDTNQKIIKYIFPPRTEEQSRDRMTKAINQYKDMNGFGKWIAIEKDTNQAIGWYILTPLLETSDIEIGYRLLPNYWGKGYATEMSKVLLDYGFNTLKINKIVGITHKDHEVSGKVLQKIGLVHSGQKYMYEQVVQFYELRNYAENHKQNTH